MVSSVLKVGDKLDIRIVQQIENQKNNDDIQILKSMIYDIKEDGLLEIAMPMESGKMVLLTQGIRYSLVFYTKHGMYQCVGQVRERYKHENLYMATVELKTTLTKFQRREYYRYECLLDISYLRISKEENEMDEIEDILSTHREEHPEDSIQNGVAVDISGGGMRFVSEEFLEKNEYIVLNLHLVSGDFDKVFWLKGRVLQSKQAGDNKGKYEHRIKFIMKDNREREQIIKYIFSEERKSIKNEKGW